MKFFHGLLECDAQVESIGDHVEKCKRCAKRLAALPPSEYERDFCKSLVGGDVTDELKELLAEQLVGAGELSESIAKNVPFPDGMGKNKKERFNRRQRIGKGHFFRCVKASDRWHQRFVAVKIPREGFLASPDHFVQFQQDCIASRQLQHPNIVSTLDFGYWDDHRWFVSTEWVDAKPLDEWLQADAFDIQHCMKVVSQICGAVEHAHQNQVVHRHLDYRNVLVADGGHAWVTDFGFVFDQRYQFDLHEDKKRLSTFLPSEFSDRNLKVNERSDIYSIGKMLNFCLGHVPEADSAVVQSLQPVISGCIAQSRSLRFSSVEALSNAIAGCHTSLAWFGK